MKKYRDLTRKKTIKEGKKPTKIKVNKKVREKSHQLKV